MATAYDNFKWRETKPGVWQRDIDEAEQFYTSLPKLYEASGRMFFAITGHVSLTVGFPSDGIANETEEHFVDAIRRAWLKLRHEQPAIAARVIYDPGDKKWKKTYETIHTIVDQGAWLDATCRAISPGQTGIEWCNSDPPAPKVPTIFVIAPPEAVNKSERAIRRDIVLRSPHDIIDGIGTLHLLNNLVTLAADTYRNRFTYTPPSFDGSEVVRLNPPFRVAAAIPAEPTPSQQERLARMAAEKATAPPANEPETLSMPYKVGPVLPGRHQRLARILSEEETARLVKACKRAGATVTHAYHAAIALSLGDLHPRGQVAKDVQYVGYILRNEREHCVDPYNTPRYAAAVYHSVSSGRLTVPISLPAVDQTTSSEQARKDEFTRVLNAMKVYYHSVSADKEHYALAPYIWAGSIPELPQSIEGVTLPVPPPKALPSASISSMGRLDSIIAAKNGDFEVYNPWVTGEELGNGLGLFLGTFRGQLELSAAYNDAWQDEERTMAFLKSCEDIVCQGFGLRG